MTTPTPLLDQIASPADLKGRSREELRQIADELHLDMRTIETYRARIKTKLNLENASQLSHEAVRWVQSTEAGLR